MSTYAQIARELKPCHQISLTLLQGGRNHQLQVMFRYCQGTDFKEEQHLRTKPHLYVSAFPTRKFPL
jgi:hypothetical protein